MATVRPLTAGEADLEVGLGFLKANGARSLWFFTVARWACIPFSILGGYICFRWARELYGGAAGYMVPDLDERAMRILGQLPIILV